MISQVIQGYLWSKMLKIRDVVPNQHWPTNFIQSSKKVIFVTKHKFRRALPWQSFEFWPWIKIIASFPKNYKLKSQNLRIQLWSLQFSKFLNVSNVLLRLPLIKYAFLKSLFLLFFLRSRNKRFFFFFENPICNFSKLFFVLK